MRVKVSFGFREFHAFRSVDEGNKRRKEGNKEVETEVMGQFYRKTEQLKS